MYSAPYSSGWTYNARSDEPRNLRKRTGRYLSETDVSIEAKLRCNRAVEDHLHTLSAIIDTILHTEDAPASCAYRYSMYDSSETCSRQRSRRAALRAAQSRAHSRLRADQATSHGSVARAGLRARLSMA